MSTKSTIAHGRSFHLYHEVFDEDYVYLELEEAKFRQTYCVLIHRLLLARNCSDDNDTFFTVACYYPRDSVGRQSVSSANAKSFSQARLASGRWRKPQSVQGNDVFFVNEFGEANDALGDHRAISRQSLRAF